jgi:hypothetical protein
MAIVHYVHYERIVPPPATSQVGVYHIYAGDLDMFAHDMTL